MLEIQRIFNQLHRKIAIVVLASLVWLITFPATSVQADGYYSEKMHKVEATKPYYSNKDRRLAATDAFRPYYATKERHNNQKANKPEAGDEYIRGGRRAEENFSRDFESRNRQNNFRNYSEPRR